MPTQAFRPKSVDSRSVAPCAFVRLSPYSLIECKNRSDSMGGTRRAFHSNERTIGAVWDYRSLDGVA
jgi:hypothetical protein